MQDLNFGKTAEGLHAKILELMIGAKGKRILDVPSGEGEMSFLLDKQGCEVVAGDIDNSVFKPKNLQFQKLDLNKELPFADHSFDQIISIEGIEHIENPFHLFREFARILRPGGDLILSTPNILSIFSRLRYLLIGYPEHFGDYYSQEKNFYVLHINAIGFPEIKLAYERSGFKLEVMTSNRNNKWLRGIPLGLLITIFQWIICLLTKWKVKDKEICKYLMSPDLLLGEILIIKLKKI